MVPIVSIVGRSKTGKTSLLELLIPVLRSRGYRVATIKHDVHGFEMDKEGKDTWRLKQAGAQSTLICSKEKLGMVATLDHELSLNELCQSYIHGADIVLTEGFKKQDKPKIEVYRAHPEGLLSGDDDKLVAVVSDDPVEVKVPVFKTDQVEAVADFIENRWLKRKKSAFLELFVNHNPVVIKAFVQDFIAKAILGMVSTLRKCGDPRVIDIHLNVEEALAFKDTSEEKEE